MEILKSLVYGSLQRLKNLEQGEYQESFQQDTKYYGDNRNILSLLEKITEKVEVTKKLPEGCDPSQ